MDWQPIESAPTDKTHILVWDNAVIIAYYEPALSGWRDVQEMYPLEPTHWMPLPNPPQTTEPRDE